MAETNCARWRFKSVPVWLREKGLAAPIVFNAHCDARSLAKRVSMRVEKISFPG